MGDRVVLRLEDIVKTFPGVKALDGVKLDVSMRFVVKTELVNRL